MRQQWILCFSLGFFAIAAHGQATRHRAIAPPVVPPSSATLIDRALSLGTITPEQALTYKIFADYADPRLPAQFHGDDSEMTEADSPGLARAQWSTLSASAQDTIGPFLVPPFYSGSWWDLRRTAGKSARTDLCKPWESSSSCAILSAWTFQSGTHIRVWYQTDTADHDGPMAADLISVDNKIWAEINKVLGRVPILEHEVDGAKLLDIVLGDGMDADVLATTYSLGTWTCSNDAAFILVNRLHPQFQDVDYRHSVIAHEMFHAAQHNYETKDCLESGYRWLMESTATWFEDEIDNYVDREHKFSKYYLSHPELSIDDQNFEGKRSRNYGAYVFFFYLTRIRHMDPTKVVRAVWEATKSADAIHALDAGIKAAGTTLDAVWPDFAAYSWNVAAPFNEYKTADNLKDQATIEVYKTIDASTSDATVEVGDSKMTLPHLSMRYYWYEFPSASDASITFFDGLDRALNDKTVRDIGTVLTAPAVSDPTTVKGAHVDALLRINGTWSHQDWTGKPYRTFCRDIHNEHVEFLILILSNSDIENTLTIHGKHPPTLLVTNIGCNAWTGSAELKYVDGSGKIETMSVANLRLDLLGDVGEDESTPSKRMFAATKGDFAWIASGSSGGCGWSGAMNGSMAGPVNVIYTFPYVPRTSNVARGILAALPQQWIVPNQILKQNCGTASETLMWNAGLFFLVTDPTAKATPLQGDGHTIIVDSNKVQGKEFNGKWNLTAVVDP